MAHKVKTTGGKKVKPKTKSQPQPVHPFEKFPVKPVNPGFVGMMKEAVKLNNQYAGLVQQYTQKQNEATIRKNYIKDLKKGNVKTPIMVQTVDGLLQPLYDIKQLIKQLESKNKLVNQSLLLVEPQISHWYDEYRDSMIRVYQTLGAILGDEKDVTNISGHRKFNDNKEKEKKIFEKDFDKLTDADIKKLKGYAAKSGKK